MNDCFGGNGANLRSLNTPARNNYFFGKLMEECHFKMEQDYFNHKRWLLNRLALGTGVLSGLRVTLAPNDSGKIMIEPGVAIDPLGREIIVPVTSRVIDPTKPIADDGQYTGEIVNSGIVYIGLVYLECPKDNVPALAQGCDTHDGCMPSTICEHYTILVRTQPPEPWTPMCPLTKPLEFTATHELTMDSKHELTKAVGKVDPSIAADRRACVPLASIKIENGGFSQESISPEIRPLVFSNDMLFKLMLCLAQPEGRNTVVPDLPKINAMSWGAHGNQISSNTFLEGISINFDIPVKKKKSMKSLEGVILLTLETPIESSTESEFAGTVQLHQLSAAKRAGIKLEENRLTFKPDQKLETSLERLIEQHQKLLVRVTVKCNFLTDKNDPKAAVDGAGTGVPGSDFISWFYLTAS